MNFVSLKDHVAKATKAANAAAKSIKSLDQMAANDAYVHSEGLNVKRKEHKDHKKMTTQTQQQKTEQKHEFGQSQTSNGQSYMLPSVAQIMKESQHRHPQQELQAQHPEQPFHMHINENGNDDDDDDDDDLRSIDSDEEYDPILQMIDQKRQRHRQRRNPQEEYFGRGDVSVSNSVSEALSVASSTHSLPLSSTHTNTTMQKPPNFYSDPSASGTSTPPTSTRKKDPNRFMTDLDARVSSPIASNANSTSNHDHRDGGTNTREVMKTNSNDEPITPPPIKTLQSFMNSVDKVGWLRNIRQNVNANLTTPSSTSDGDIECQPLTLPKRQRAMPNNCDEDDVQVVQSSAFLDNDEEANAELLRIRQRMTSNTFMTYFNPLLDLLEKNRHYGVVVITFFMTTLFYFLTRKKTDDSVTR